MPSKYPEEPIDSNTCGIFNRRELDFIKPNNSYLLPNSFSDDSNTNTDNLDNKTMSSNTDSSNIHDDTMYVTKRDGTLEEMSFDKITKRLRKLSHGLALNATKIAQNIIDNLYDKIPSCQIDELAAEMCASNIALHPDYGTLASRIIVSNHHKNTSPSFSETIQMLWDNTDVHNKHCPVVNERLYKMTMENKEKINSIIDYQKDYLTDYFGFKTLERAYLLKANGRIVERYQHLLMRVALGIHKDDIREALRSYKMMSEGYFTHATPTLFNVGTQHEQAFSCFLLQIESDSISGIYKTLTDCAQISKWAGGIGIAIHKIRAKGSEIRGTQGVSNGIVPMLKNFNSTAQYVDQGGGKRNGSFAIYLEPWHADIFDFLMLRRNTGAESERARDLFYAMWIPDLFMERVRDDGDWTLMCPDECPGLHEVYGEDFVALYTKYESEGRGRRTVKAHELWKTILDSQIENGMPYICYKDAINQKSNQKNLGTIQSSNLCVAGDTMIFTKKGYIPIESVAGNEVEIWNGEEWSTVKVEQTGSDQKMMEIEFSNGSSLKCTPYHKFYIADGYNGKYVEKRANELKENDKLIKWNLPEVMKGDEFSQTMKYPYTHGFFCGDGTTYDNYSKTKKYCKVYLYDEKTKLLPYIECRLHNRYKNRISCELHYDIEPKYTVPMNCTLDTRLRWLEGYFDADGTVAKNGTNEAIQAASTNIKFLTEIKYMLHTIGVESKITHARDAGAYMMPDGKGGSAYFNCKKIWRILISSTGVGKLVDAGYSPKRLTLTNHIPNRCAEQFVKVCKTTSLDTHMDTYCFNEPKRHMGMFNGILTGNCSEIVEYTSPDEHAVCCLLSVALPKFLEPSPFMLEVVEKPGCVTVYGKPGCAYCNHAKHMLDNRGIRYVYVNLDNLPADKREATLERLADGFLNATATVQDNIGKQAVDKQPTTENLPSDNSKNQKPRMECEGDSCKLILPSADTNDTTGEKADDENSGKKPRARITLPIITITRQVIASYEGNKTKDEDNGKQNPTEVEEVIGGAAELEKALVPVYNFERLREVTKMAVRNLNKLIDYNYYPVPETETSNRRHRPIGIGIQGLADVFAQLKMPFDSQSAVDMNSRIAEHMYLAAMEASMEIARRRKPYIQQYRRLLKRHDKGETLTEQEQSDMRELKEKYFIYPDEVEKLPMSLAGAYSTFVGSPASEGHLQYDLWGVKPSDELADKWTKLKADVAKHGIRNSLLMARMPTASTSQILGNNECMEPYTNNIYTRKVLAGNYIIINRHLIRDLLDLGLWSSEMKDRMLLANGSVQDIPEIPIYIKNCYRTVWEMKQKWLIEHAKASGPFICQTQSMNLFINNPTHRRLTNMHFYAWGRGLKTGVYYTRTKAKSAGSKFAVDATKKTESVPSAIPASNGQSSSHLAKKKPVANHTIVNDGKIHHELQARKPHAYMNHDENKDEEGMYHQARRVEELLKAEADAAPEECLNCSA